MLVLTFSPAFGQPGVNPYGGIAQRNIFALKPPLPPPTPFPPQPPAQPPPNLVLTGIADFSTSKWAFVTRTDPGRQSTKHTLSPGEVEGGLQLLGIDAAHDTATLLVDGRQTVTLHLIAATNPPVRPTVPAQLSSTSRSAYLRTR